MSSQEKDKNGKNKRTALDAVMRFDHLIETLVGTSGPLIGKKVKRDVDPLGGPEGTVRGVK